MNLVLDTNIVLDLWVFYDAGVVELRAAIARKEVTWLATGAMRDELASVLAYSQMCMRMDAARTCADEVLRAFDTHATLVEAPARAPVTCGDCDDQKFIDLAVAHDSLLLSKDAQVLALRRKLRVARAFSAPTPPKTGPDAPSASNS